MKKIKFYIIVNALALVLIVLFFEQNRIEKTNDHSILINSALESYKIELSLHRNLIGYKFSDFDSIFVNNSERKINDSTKLVFLLLDSKDDGFDSEKTIIAALDYYIEAKNSSKDFRNTELFLIKKNTSSSLENYIQENQKKNGIRVLNETKNYFTDDYSFPQKGAVVMLLNSRNVCQYAYYLEKSNARRVFENSTVISNIIKNGYE